VVGTPVGALIGGADGIGAITLTFGIAGGSVGGCEYIGGDCGNGPNCGGCCRPGFWMADGIPGL
jgi:hypothetical protein